MRPQTKPVVKTKKRYVPIGKEFMIEEIKKRISSELTLNEKKEVRRYGKPYTMLKFEPKPEETEETE